MDLLNFYDHNWKKYEALYEGEDNNLVSFDPPINESSFNKQESFHQFSFVKTRRIFVRIYETQIPNEEKYLHRFTYAQDGIATVDEAVLDNQRIGLDIGDIVYCVNNSITPDASIEIPLSRTIESSHSVQELIAV